MYTEILIVSLLHATLARNIPNARPYIRKNINSERQFYLRDPESENYEIRNHDTLYSTADFSDYRYSDGNHGSDLYGRYITQNEDEQKPLNNERAFTRNKEYRVTNGGGTDQHNEGADTRDESYESGKVNHPRRRNHNRNRNSAHSRVSDEKDTLKTNLDSSSQSHPNQRSEDIASSYQQAVKEQVRTNKQPTDNADISQHAIIPVDITTVPVIPVMPVTLKTNPNFHSRFAATETADDSHPEVRSNSDSVTFSDADNPKPSSSDKATTDNEVRYSKNDTDDKNEEDRWIWSTVTTASTPVQTEKMPPDGDLDDRTSFNGDGCPQGQSKVLGKCVTPH